MHTVSTPTHAVGSHSTSADLDARSSLHLHQILDLHIQNITNEGAGVARHHGIVVFIPFTLIGETVRARITHVHKHYAEALIETILQPSPDRITPRCPYFTQCGGCQYQHIRYETQLHYKRAQIIELLEKMARIPDAQRYVAPTVPSPQIYGYRTKLTPHFTLPQKTPHPSTPPPLGFLRKGSRHHIIDIERCHIATDAVNAALSELRARFAQDWRRYKRGATFLIRQTAHGILTDPNAVATHTVSGLTLRFPAGDFFQNNASILDPFVNHIIQEARGLPHLVDAYCGSGLFSLCAAQHFERIYGIEISADAVARAQENVAINAFSHIHILQGDASSIFSQLPIEGNTTALIIDPPRRGCDSTFLHQCLAFAPARIIYVSCYPSTQIRDLRTLLAHGYQLQHITPFDLFPHTKHIETVMTLHRSPSP